ncbi:hypothetical protein GMA8713_02296 [Grimontia marina]|uniref:Uncharacterized protein n=2 Tax=Grimontia marina TaxID=646534 RepID=A0A128F7B6_9GAMM|nr:hypothetical protein GMA8713_02296 [Grimontia marina]
MKKMIFNSKVLCFHYFKRIISISFMLVIFNSILACADTSIISPKEVKSKIVDKESFCEDSSLMLSPASVLVVGVITEEVSKYLVKELTKVVKDELDSKVSVFKGKNHLGCDIADNRVESDNIKFELEFFKREKVEQIPNDTIKEKLVVPFELTTSTYFYDLTFAPSQEFVDGWFVGRELFNIGESFNGRVFIYIKWVTYSRDNEKTISNSVFNGAVAEFKVKDGKIDLDWLKNNDEFKREITKEEDYKSKVTTGIRPPRSQSSNKAHPQLHLIDWSLVFVDESISSKALRKVHEVLTSKKDKITESVVEEIDDALGLGEN